MKRTFAVLLLNAGQKAATAADSASSKSAALRKLATEMNLTVYTEADLVEPTPGDTADVESPIDKLTQNLVLLIGGSPSAAQLKEACATLAQRDFDFIVIIDALDNRDELRAILEEFNEKLVVTDGQSGNEVNYGIVQLSVIGSLKPLIKSKRLMIYAFPKPDSTITVAYIIDAGTPEAKVLTITRLHDPGKGELCLPGGFINVHLEDLPTGGSRESGEECHVRPGPGELVLVDVRSSPDRDPRGHMIDHGYAWFVPAEKKDAVLAAVQAGDDAQPGSAAFTLVSEVLAKGLNAFPDHMDLLKAALLLAPVKK